MVCFEKKDVQSELLNIFRIYFPIRALRFEIDKVIKTDS